MKSLICLFAFLTWSHAYSQAPFIEFTCAVYSFKFDTTTNDLFYTNSTPLLLKLKNDNNGCYSFLSWSWYEYNYCFSNLNEVKTGEEFQAIYTEIDYGWETEKTLDMTCTRTK